jgi:spoIIIJ-associated protein
MSDDAPERSQRPADDPAAEASGPSVGEAKWAVMKELEPRFPGITSDCVEFQVLDDGDDGEAKVVGRVDAGAWEELATTIPDDPAERLRDLVTRTVHALGLRATVDIAETDDEIRADVDGDDLGLLIGKHGATIDALQHLAVRIVLRDGVRDKQVLIDAGGYRGRREEALHRAADRAASEALEYGRAVELEPMRAFERKVVHGYLSSRTDIATHSEGDEPDRRLVVTPASQSGS